MDLCFLCDKKAAWECECHERLCHEHGKWHIKYCNHSRIKSTTHDSKSVLRRISSKKMLSQGKVLNQNPKKIQKTSNLSVLSNTVLKIQDPSFAPVKKYLQNYFQVPSYQK